MNMEEFAKSLTEEQAKKFDACKTIEDVTAVAREEKLALPDEVLDGIAGGRCNTGTPGDPFYDFYYNPKTSYRFLMDRINHRS
jgi:hypothetical protein